MWTVRSLEEIAAALYALLPSAEKIPFHPAGIGDGSKPDDWRPAPATCYDNVDIWCRFSPQYKVVRGWAVFNIPQSILAQHHFQFVGHSAVEAPEGGLMDITPAQLLGQRPTFIRHDGSFEEFEALRFKHVPLRTIYFPK